MCQIDPSMTPSEEISIKKSFNEYVPLWFDTGKMDKDGNKIFRSLDSEQEQIFLDEEI